MSLIMHQILNSLNLIKNSLIERNVSNEYIRVALKEELQNYILSVIYNSEKIDSLIFIGGTCLRKLWNLNRLSEDLDFENPEGLSLETIGEEIAEYFRKIKFDKVDYAIQSGASIYRLTVRFQVLHDLELSPNESEKLHVKVELSDSPNRFRVIQTTFSHDNLSMVIKHHDLETMMAGKIGACLQRIWEKGDTGIKVKGRDYYDLIWYMQKGINPNIDKLKAENIGNDLKTVFSQLDEKVALIKSSDLYSDLKSFFESDKFIRDWCEHFHEFYERYRKNY